MFRIRSDHRITRLGEYRSQPAFGIVDLTRLYGVIHNAVFLR
jgi:hypothetical protein